MKKKFISGGALLAVALTANAQIEVATFENLDLPDNSYWCGELDEEDEDLGFSTSWFDSGSFEFNNFYWPDYSTWSFFAYSSRTGKTFVTMKDDQFNSITGGGAGGSRIFGVAFPASYMGNTVMEVNYGSSPTVIPGMEIVNTAWVVDCILNGDGYEGPFATGDWLKLILTGYIDNQPGKTQEYYLADYRSENPEEHYYLDNWTWIDLAVLGEVDAVHFNIESSKTNAYGPTTPTYVCIDNVGISQESSEINMPTTTLLNLNLISGTRHVAVSGIQGSAIYFVADMTGGVVKNGNLSERNATIDLSNLGSGIYIVSVSDGETNKSLKVIL